MIVSKQQKDRMITIRGQKDDSKNIEKFQQEGKKMTENVEKGDKQRIER